MDVNSVSNVAATYAAYETKGTKKTEAAKESTAPVKEEAAAVYEKSDEAKAYEASTKAADTKTVQQMLADSEERVNSFREMIKKMFSQQANANDLAGDIWKKLASGDFTVDAATKAQAQQDISEDGYWGVKQTSGRILDFAKALAGSDPAKLEKMRTAFEKGYKQAEKTWGGQLPDISKQTYDAVMKGFDELTKTEEA